MPRLKHYNYDQDAMVVINIIVKVLSCPKEKCRDFPIRD